MTSTSHKQFRVRLDTAGRVVLPAEFRRRWGLSAGDELVAEEDGPVLHIKMKELVLREVQEFFRRFIPPGVSLVDELIKDRREEVARGE